MVGLSVSGTGIPSGAKVEASAGTIQNAEKLVAKQALELIKEN